MSEHSSKRLGGIAAIALGILYLIMGFNFIAGIPAEQKTGIPSEILPSFASNPFPLLFQDGITIVNSLIGIAVVLAILPVVSKPGDALMRWASVVGVVGFLATTFGGVSVIALLPPLAQQYVTGDAATKAAAIVVYPFLFPDPAGWLRFGAVGVWALVVNLTALRNGSAPRALVYTGLGMFVLYWCLVFGAVLERPVLMLIGAGLSGIVFASIWYIGMGLHLLSERPAVRQSGVEVQTAQ